MVDYSSHLQVERLRSTWYTALGTALTALSGCSYGASIALANEPPASSQDAAKAFPAYSFLTQRETWAAFAVLIFGMAMCMFALIVIRRGVMSPEPVIRLIALILIVTGTLFLVTAGYSADQIAPALGLLGSIAGYLLGRADSRANGAGKGSSSDAHRG